MFDPNWFERPSRWLDKMVEAQTEDVQNRIPVDDEKLARLRNTKRALRKPETRFLANLIWWGIKFQILFNFSYIGFLILWKVT